MNNAHSNNTPLKPLISFQASFAGHVVLTAPAAYLTGATMVTIFETPWCQIRGRNLNSIPSGGRFVNLFNKLRLNGRQFGDNFLKLIFFSAIFCISVPMVQLKLYKPSLKKWPGAIKRSNNYLNQWYPDFLPHVNVNVNQPRRVKKPSGKMRVCLGLCVEIGNVSAGYIHVSTGSFGM